MRVLWFTNIPTQEAAEYLGYKSLNIGGWIESLKNELVLRNDIELGIAFVAGDNSYKVFNHNSLKYYKLPYLRPIKGIRARIANLTHQLESLEVVDYCLKAIDDFKPDIIHIFGTERNYGLIIYKTNVPCIVHIQGIINEIIKNYFSGISIYDILIYGYRYRLISGHSILHNYLLMKKQAKRELKIFQNCKYFMGRTAWDRELVNKYSPGAKYYHCEEIMRDEFYKLHWTKQVDNRNKIVAFSTMNSVNYKGIETLAECGNIFKERYSTDIEFRIGGVSSRDEVYKIILRKYGKDIQNFITPLGSIPASEVVKEMLSADIFVHPSHIDNSPNSVCEAMLVGTPVVSTDVGGIPSLIENGVDGLLVPPGNANLMSEVILRIINDKVLADKLSKNAKKRAIKRHDKKIILVQLFEIYNDILNNA